MKQGMGHVRHGGDCWLSHTEEKDPCRKSILLFYGPLLFCALSCPACNGLIHVSGALMAVSPPHTMPVPGAGTLGEALLGRGRCQFMCVGGMNEC